MKSYRVELMITIESNINSQFAKEEIEARLNEFYARLEKIGHVGVARADITEDRC